MTTASTLRCRLLAATIVAGVLAVLAPVPPATAGEMHVPGLGVTLKHWGVSPRVDIFWDEAAPGPDGTTYDVRLFRTDARAPRPNAWTYPTQLQGITYRGFSRAIQPGWVVCASVRMRLGDQISGWSPRVCAARGFDQTTATLRGRVRIVHDARLWAGRGMVPLGAGRIVVRGIAAKSVIAMIDAYRGGQRSYGFVCGSASFSDTRVAGQGPPWFNRLASYYRRPTDKCRLVVKAWQGDPGFIIEALYVEPPWMD